MSNAFFASHAIVTYVSVVADKSMSHERRAALVVRLTRQKEAPKTMPEKTPEQNSLSFIRFHSKVLQKNELRPFSPSILPALLYRLPHSLGVFSPIILVKI